MIPPQSGQGTSESQSGQSVQQHQMHMDTIFMVCTCEPATFIYIPNNTVPFLFIKHAFNMSQAMVSFH